MRHPWLYVLRGATYPADTYAVLLTQKSVKAVREEMGRTHFHLPDVLLGYAIADYDGVRKRLQPLLSKVNPSFVHMELGTLQKKIEGVVIGRAPTPEQLDMLKFVGGQCGRVDASRCVDLYHAYRKSGGRRTMAALTHLLQSIGFKKKRYKWGMVFKDLSLLEPDTVARWWSDRLKNGDHVLYQQPAQVWESYQMFVHGQNIKDTTNEDWFWRRLGHLVEFQRLKLPDQSTAITFPSADVCRSLLDMADGDA
jgi:hypothetical protein